MKEKLWGTKIGRNQARKMLATVDERSHFVSVHDTTKLEIIRTKEVSLKHNF